MTELVLLKLGGSLITDKRQPYTPRLDRLRQLVAEIAAARRTHPALRLILGHGSGSFGHTAARQYGTRNGVHQLEDWKGFAEVWFQASALNRFVMDCLHAGGIPAVAFSPVSAVVASDGHIQAWNLTPLKAALANDLLPVVYGDVIVDEVRGGTILSTEDLFVHLAQELRPQRVLLAGLEGAVWADFPQRRQRVETITPASFDEVRRGVGASQAVDVTGGMQSKVTQMLTLVQQVPDLTVQIFSGETPGYLQRALGGECLGTLITA